MERQGGDNAPVDWPPAYRRPEDTPNFDPDCPVCFEPLFNAEGIAPQDRDVSKIICIHLVHTHCLTAASRALNADGQRYGVSVFGPRAGCPICGTPVSAWTTHTAAADFPIFWMHRIQACLEEIGPEGGPVPVDRIKTMLRNDTQLTNLQKELLDAPDDHLGLGTNGFTEALGSGSRFLVTVHVNGGMDNGGSTTQGYQPGCWDWDKKRSTLWMQKWGPAPDYEENGSVHEVEPGESANRDEGGFVF